MARIFRTDGTTEDVAMTELSHFQTAVGGYIEVADRDDEGNFILVNEEGLMRGLPSNPFYAQYVGNVVRATPEEFN